MFRAVNDWLHNLAHAITHFITGRNPHGYALEGFGPVRDVGIEPLKDHDRISQNQVDLGGWHVILVGDLVQAKSAIECLDLKKITEREILPIGQRGYLVRWK